jgi:hypothetical protein
MEYSYNNLTNNMKLSNDDYFKKYKNIRIANTIKFIKKSLNEGVELSFINSEKEGLRKIIATTNLEQLIAVERNLVSSNNVLHLSKAGSNKMKQCNKKRDLKTRLMKKLIKKNLS